MTGCDDAVGVAHASVDGPGPELDRIRLRPPAALLGPLGGRAPTRLLLTPDGGEFRIEVLGPEDAVQLSLGPFPLEEVVAVWRSLAAASGLPLAFRNPEGAVEDAFSQLGRLQVGCLRDRRRLGVLNGRRPRFLVRRKLARLPARPIIYRECEIARGQVA